MTKIIIVYLFISFVSFNSVETKVYIRVGGNAKKYHLTETCRGLNACKHKLIKSTQEKATAMGLTLCKWE